MAVALVQPLTQAILPPPSPFPVTPPLTRPFGFFENEKAVTVIQLAGGEGNLLASAVVTAYATFLCFSAVSKTPTSSCNPFVGESNLTVVLIGLGLTLLSLIWWVL